MVGNIGTILHTADGGKKWETQSSGTNNPLTSVFGSRTELWAVGESGTIVHGVAAGRYPYITAARLRRDLTEARVEFQVAYPDVKPATMRAALAGSNEFNFAKGITMPAPSATELTKPERETNLWAFSFSPDGIGVRPGERAHLRIELTT